MMGLFQTLNWMRVHSIAQREFSTTARAFTSLLSNNDLGRGVFVANDRDTMTYVLYGLGNAPKVISRPLNSIINATDVEGAEWILFKGKYITAFDYKQAIVVGPLTFIPLRKGITLLPKEKSGEHLTQE
jgi:hypothetical protein